MKKETCAKWLDKNRRRFHCAHMNDEEILNSAWSHQQEKINKLLKRKPTKLEVRRSISYYKSDNKRLRFKVNVLVARLEIAKVREYEKERITDE